MNTVTWWYMLWWIETIIQILMLFLMFIYYDYHNDSKGVLMICFIQTIYSGLISMSFFFVGGSRMQEMIKRGEMGWVLGLFWTFRIAFLIASIVILQIYGSTEKTGFRYSCWISLIESSVALIFTLVLYKLSKR